jgi:small conductance mechanosensitive channel
LQQWGAVIVDAVVEQGPNYIFQTLLFIGIIFIFLKISVLVQRGVDKALNANSKNVSELLRRMISTTSKTIVIMFGVLIALSQFGISLGPLLTGLGIAGFIVGFALQDSLSNFASGMMILFYRPYDVGDTIVTGTVSGNVSSMSLVNTTIRTFDNQSLIIPNNKIWQDVITNLTDQTERRIDMEFGITYDEDIDRVEKLLFEVIAANKRVLENPKPDVVVGSFGDSSVNLLCRPWVKTADYWEVRFELHRQIKQAFDREGVVIPFPQRDVHMIQPESSIT